MGIYKYYRELSTSFLYARQKTYPWVYDPRAVMHAIASLWVVHVRAFNTVALR